MIHVIYDMDSGLSLPDNKVKDYTFQLVSDHAMSEDTFEIRIGNKNIVRSIAYSMKHLNINSTRVSITYAHAPDVKIWIDDDYNFDGIHDFCDHDIDVLMDLF